MRVFVALAAVLSALGLAFAQAAGLDQAEALLRDGQPSEARRVAEAAPATSPDDALRRDWLIAQSHLRENAPRAALPVLERLVSAAPGVTRFRLELARTLFLIEDDARARLHFEQALGGRLALSEIQAVQEYLTVMDRRKSWEGHARVALAPQSNAHRRSGLDSVRIGDALEVPLAPVERATGMEVEAGGTWLPGLGRDLRGRFHASALAQVHEGAIADAWALRAEAGLLVLRDRGAQFGGGVSARLHLTDGSTMARGLGAYATWQAPLRPDTLLSLRAEAERLRYPAAPALDGPRYGFTARLLHVRSPQLRLTFGAELGAQRPEAAFQRRISAAVSLGAEYAFEGGLVAAGDVTLARVRYGAEHPFFPGAGARRDNRLDVTGRVLHRDWAWSGFAPVLEVGYERQGSSIPFHAFDNLRVSLGATRRF